ncbi:uncharacterized protein LOC134825332 [Bolinopsis microptera]|uniref:uncharacterized protein LOC134825332 n=1 Tax=Bolinopsis microptera TaxID=2820187 RepID=UPI003078FA44
MAGTLSNTFLFFILVGGVWCKGAGGGKGGGRGNIQVDSPKTEVIDIGASGSVKNMGKLANHNWLIYGPILVCICLITLCMMYDKIYRCYLSNQDMGEKEGGDVPTLVIESAPSKQQLLASNRKPNLDNFRMMEQTNGKLTGSDQMGSIGYSDTERAEATRKLGEKLHESAGQYWISDHHRYNDEIQTDGIRLNDHNIYSHDPQRQGLTSHSNTFTIGTQSGTLHLRTESPDQPLHLDLEAIRTETLNLGSDTQARLKLQSELEVPRAGGKFDTMESQRMNGRQNDRMRSETERSETARSYKSERSGGRIEKGAKLRMGESEISGNLYHLLPSEDQSTG